MFCSECGVKATGKFCHACGARLATAETAIAPALTPAMPPAVEAAITPQVAAIPWQSEIRYAELLKVPHIRDTLAKLTMEAEPGMSATDILNVFDSAFKPMGPISMSKIAPVLQSMYGKWGINTGKQRQEVLATPPGVVIFNLLCALTKRGQKIREVTQGEDGCILQAVIPSSLWTMEGKLLVTVSKVPQGTQVEAATRISGQMYDWGMSNRLLDELFRGLKQTP